MRAYHYSKSVEHFSFEDKKEYSRFKHGSKSVARKYGKFLAMTFINSPEFERILKLNKTIVICSAPYNNIPTPSFTLKDYFMSSLAKFLIDTDIEIEEVKISRKHSYTSEYGEMTVEERATAISADTFQIDSKFVSGKHIIFVDDVRITGAHEDRIKSMCERYKLKNTMSFVYYAAVATKIDPKIENELNHFQIKGIDDILELILQDEFIFNTRVVKKILRSTIGDLKKFVVTLQTRSYTWALVEIDTLVTYAILNNYHKDETMTYNIGHLNAILHSHERALI